MHCVTESTIPQLNNGPRESNAIAPPHKRKERRTRPPTHPRQGVHRTAPADAPFRGRAKGVALWIMGLTAQVGGFA